MKIVMTLLVRDEQDILQPNIDFHRRQGVDFFIVTDNRSVDTTPEILKEYEKQGILLYVWEGEDDYNQTKWVTRMARRAFDEFQADWVINNDADEFWWPVQGSLRSTFEAVPAEYNVVRAQRYNFVPVEGADGPFYESMIFRHKVSLNPLGKPLPPKVAHRGHPQVSVSQGNHGVFNIGPEKVLEEVIEILHFPMRSYEQLTNKIVKGGQALERNLIFDESVVRTWRKLYRQYQKNGLVRYYSKQQFSPKQLEKHLRKGKLIRDTRLADYLQSVAGH